MIQQGVSAGGDHAGENPMSVGRIMDWVEARCDAIKTREEEEDEEEQKEKEKDPQPPQSGPKPPSRTRRQVSVPPSRSSHPSVKQPIRLVFPGRGRTGDSEFTARSGLSASSHSTLLPFPLGVTSPFTSLSFNRFLTWEAKKGISHPFHNLGHRTRPNR